MIYLRSEPCGEGYQALLRFLKPYCDSFELVLRRKHLKPNESARKVISELAPFELSHALTQRGGLARSLEQALVRRWS